VSVYECYLLCCRLGDIEYGFIDKLTTETSGGVSEEGICMTVIVLFWGKKAHTALDSLKKVQPRTTGWKKRRLIILICPHTVHCVPWPPRQRLCCDRAAHVGTDGRTSLPIQWRQGLSL
jgi:hypothetical protein